MFLGLQTDLIGIAVCGSFLFIMYYVFGLTCPLLTKLTGIQEQPPIWERRKCKREHLSQAEYWKKLQEVYIQEGNPYGDDAHWRAWVKHYHYQYGLWNFGTGRHALGTGQPAPYDPNP